MRVCRSESNRAGTSKSELISAYLHGWDRTEAGLIIPHRPGEVPVGDKDDVEQPEQPLPDVRCWVRWVAEEALKEMGIVQALPPSSMQQPERCSATCWI